MRKFLSLTLAVLMMISSFAFALPNGTLVIDDKAFDVNYVVSHDEDVYNVFTASNGKVYYKDFEGKWSGILGDATAADIPQVTYTDSEGNQKVYAEKDGDVLEEKAISSVKVLDENTLRVYFTDNSAPQTVTDFSPKPLAVGQKTEVTFNINGQEVKKEVVLAPLTVKITNVEQLLKSSEDGDLRANDNTVYKVYFDVEGGDTVIDGTYVKFNSKTDKINVASAQGEKLFDDNKKSNNYFNVRIPLSEVPVDDIISVEITSSASHDLKNIEVMSEEVALHYEPYNPKTDVSTIKTFNIDKVSSTNTADRVYVFVGEIDNSDVEAVKDAIVNQLRVGNRLTAADYRQPVAVVDDAPTELSATSAKHAFTVLLDIKPEGSNRDYGFGGLSYLYDPDLSNVESKIADGQKVVLEDNALNFYKVVESSLTFDADDNRVTLNPIETAKKFFLIDGKAPKMEDVFVLDEGHIAIKFSEGVDRVSAEDPRNWAINNKNLGLNSEGEFRLKVNNIIALDAYSQENDDNKGYIENIDRIQKARGIDFDKERDARNYVLIKLTNSALKNYIDEGKDANFVSVTRVKDFAGLWDFTMQNEISSQEKTFTYKKQPVDNELTIRIQSPEQYKIMLNSRLYTDEEAANLVSLVTAANNTINGNDTYPNVTFHATLLNGNGTGVNYTLEYGKDYILTPYPGEPQSYLLELQKDWTELLNEPNAYHNKYFQVWLEGKAYDANGDIALDWTSDTNLAETIADKKPLTDKVFVKEDVKSPLIADWSHSETTSGAISLEFNEPVKLFDFRSEFRYPDATKVPGSTDANHTTASAIVVLNTPTYEALTPSLEQSYDFMPFWEGVPTPSFEYVKMVESEDAQAEELYGSKYVSQSYRVKGEIVDESVNLEEKKFKVIPVDDNGDYVGLSAGEWKLVVRQVSDDVGNTISTRELPFVVKGAVKPAGALLDPYVIWAYVVDGQSEEVQKELGEALDHDYAYILYSREMTKASTGMLGTYEINGEKAAEGVIIDSETIKFYRKPDGSLYDEPWAGYLVKIQLPERFVQNGDNINHMGLDGVNRNAKHPGVITIPDSVRALDDDNAATVESLIFRNNVEGIQAGAKNNYEVKFQPITGGEGDYNYGSNEYNLLSIAPEADFDMYRTPDAHWSEVKDTIKADEQDQPDEE